MRYESSSKFDKAEEAYLRAAAGGYLEAYKKLGDLYWNGLSENAKNANKYLLSINFYEKANVSDISDIYMKAGMLYIGDKTGVKDGEQLLIKLTNLGKKDDKTAQAYYLLSTLYLEDNKEKGLKKDLSKAEQYLKSAAEMGHNFSQKKLADFYIRRKKYDDALQWFSVLDKQKDPHGTYGMGNLIYSGYIKSIKNNRTEGIKLIIQAAEMGYKDAYNSLRTLSEESPAAKEAYDKLTASKKF